MARAPLYLARESYRRRRLTDAARLLPVVGIVLFILPMLWTSPDEGGAGTAGAKLYLFAVWLGLVITAHLLSRALSRPVGGAEPSSPVDDADRKGR